MLKAVVADISTVDEGLRPLYEEKNGRHVLKVEPAEGYKLENIDGLTNALAAARTERDAFKMAARNVEGLDVHAAKDALAKVQAFAGLDPADVKSKLEAYEKLASLDPAKEADRLANEKFEASKKAMQARFTTDKEALDAENKALKERLKGRDTQVEKLLKQHTISTELSKLNPLDEARDVLTMLASQSIKLVEHNGEQIPVVVDESGNARTKINPADYSSIAFTVADFMAELKEKKAVLFKPENTRAGIGTNPQDRSGSAAAASGDYNPWAKGTVNKTMQVFMESRDPTRAARLKAEAGV